MRSPGLSRALLARRDATVPRKQINSHQLHQPLRLLLPNMPCR